MRLVVKTFEALEKLIFTIVLLVERWEKSLFDELTSQRVCQRASNASEPEELKGRLLFRLVCLAWGDLCHPRHLVEPRNRCHEGVGASGCDSEISDVFHAVRAGVKRAYSIFLAVSLISACSGAPPQTATAQGRASLGQLDRSLRTLSENVNEAVVQVVARGLSPGALGPTTAGRQIGSGVFVSKEGLLITNAHVVLGGFEDRGNRIRRS